MIDIFDIMKQKGTVVVFFQYEDVYFYETIKQEFVRYIEQAFNNNDVVRYGDYLIDVEALTRVINLDCINCHQINDTCCCGASPVAFPRHSLLNVLANYEEIITERFSEKQRQIIEEKGIFDEHLGRMLSPKTMEWGCVFLMKKGNGVRRCAIKDWCLENNKRITDFCSTSCLLFPMDVFEIRSISGRKFYYITSVLKDEIATKYSRWGDISALNLPCIDYSRVPDIFNGEIFKDNEYTPIYLNFKELLIQWFGQNTYSYIDEQCKIYMESKEKISKV